MTNPDLKNLTIKSLHNGLKRKDFSATEITKEYLANIEARDKEIGAYLSIDTVNALVEAEKTDQSISENRPLAPLAGVPMGIKDAILVRGMKATAGSKILENYTAAYDATVIAKLRAAGAVILGKTNLDEFAMGSSTENSAYHPTKNPHDLSRVPGGSSGGSAAAVAGELALAALGSDTGGSIRQPAHFCGVVGMKPTYGAVSRHGLIAMSSSLDQIGPFARTVEDAAQIFQAISGKDSFDATSFDSPAFTLEPQRIRGMKIGIPKEYFVAGLETEVAHGMNEVIQSLRMLGATTHDISLPHTKYALSVYYIVMPAEVSSNLARYDSLRYGASADLRGQKRGLAQNLLDSYKHARSQGFGAETKRRVILGTYVLSSGYYDAYYTKAQKVRTLIKNDFTEAFKKVDVILTPVAPTRAFKFGEKTSDPLQMYLSDILTIPANLAGIPGISIPIKTQMSADTTLINKDMNQRESASHLRPSASLPIGFQLLARTFREKDLFDVGIAYEMG